MNIFVLSTNPAIAASYHADKHVVKMVVETAQLLSTAHHVLDGDKAKDLPIYKPTHQNHPCAVWVRESSENYKWTVRLFDSLLQEYTNRYGKVHACERLYKPLLKTPDRIPLEHMTPFTLCMPDQYKTDDPVESYRNFYIYEKAEFAKWRLGNTPDWFLTMENNNADLFI